MLRLFRRIRQKLLTENKVSKYLLYAVGEILLVVIGILIALQVNNWNEKRLESAQIKAQLVNLMSNLEGDRGGLKEMRSFHAFRVHGAHYLLDQYGFKEKITPYPEAGPTPELDESALYGGPIPDTSDHPFTVRAFSWLIRNNYPSPNEDAMEEFKNTGLYAQLENTELKNEIRTYYGRYNWLFPVEDRGDSNHSALLRNTLVSLGYSYLDVAVLEDPVSELLSYPTIVALLKNIIDDSTFKAGQAALILGQLDDLVLDIENEINSYPPN